jgi:alkylation response protein AidB-like acyl-CoA dehydrogenase
VPVTDRIGEEHLGWGLVRTSLGHERAAGTLNTALNYRRVVTEVLQLAKDLGVTGDPLIRQQLADFEARVRILYVSGARTIADITSKGEPGPASSVSRLFVTSFEQDLHEFVVNMLGAHGMLARKDPHSIEKGRWVWGFLRTRASTIGAGTAEIQKNTVGERVLGLPHEPSVK